MVKMVIVQLSEASVGVIASLFMGEAILFKIASSLRLLAMTQTLPRAELLLKMKKIIITAFFSLIFCRDLCLGADNGVSLRANEVSEAIPVEIASSPAAPRLPAGKAGNDTLVPLSVEVKKLKTENKDLENKLAAQKNINSQLEEKAKEFYIKAKDCGEKSHELDSLNSLLDKLNKERVSFKNKNEKLYNDIAALKDTAKKEKAELYQDLGTAYTQAKLYDNAIEAYEKSLGFDQRNADVYYYLGLLYKHSNKNDKKAIHNLKRYLDYNPQAKNKDEVKYLIDMLKDEF